MYIANKDDGYVKSIKTQSQVRDFWRVDGVDRRCQYNDALLLHLLVCFFFLLSVVKFVDQIPICLVIVERVD
jgi:hypothetical protein